MAITLSHVRENLLAAIETLRSAKVRSFLTVMGIVIGVSSVISMAAIIGGLNKFVADKVQSLGSRTYFVTRFPPRSEEHTSELQSRRDLVCRLLLEKKKKSHLDSLPLKLTEPYIYPPY